jgi:hypothetical protein
VALSVAGLERLFLPRKTSQGRLLVELLAARQALRLVVRGAPHWELALAARWAGSSANSRSFSDRRMQTQLRHSMTDEATGFAYRWPRKAIEGTAGRPANPRAFA